MIFERNRSVLLFLFFTCTKYTTPFSHTTSYYLFLKLSGVYGQTSYTVGVHVHDHCISYACPVHNVAHALYIHKNYLSMSSLSSYPGLLTTAFVACSIASDKHWVKKDCVYFQGVPWPVYTASEKNKFMQLHIQSISRSHTTLEHSLLVMSMLSPSLSLPLDHCVGHCSEKLVQRHHGQVLGQEQDESL